MHGLVDSSHRHTANALLFLGADMNAVTSTRTQIITDIPPEILRDIFHESLLDDNSARNGISADSSVLTPLRISHVCWRWRDISLSYGALWSYLSIDQFDFDTEMIAQIFEAWLRRTDGYPLNFRFFWNFLEELSDEEHLIACNITVALLSEQHRWKDVDFTWEFIEQSPMELKIRATNMPLLTSLTLYVGYGTSPGRTHIDIARSSRLQNVDLTGELILDVGTELIHTLRSWKWTYSGPPSLTFLNVSPNLEHLNLRVNSNHVGLVDDMQELVLPNLRKLSAVDGLARLFLDESRLRSLTTLRCGDIPDSGSIRLLRFIERSRPPLTHLIIFHNIWDESLIPVLHLLPALEALEIRAIDRPIWLFDALMIANPDGQVLSDDNDNAEEVILCPHLTSLAFQPCRKLDDSSLRDYSSMLHSHRRRFQSFEEVIINDYLLESFKFLPIPFNQEDHNKFRTEGAVIWATSDRTKFFPFEQRL